MCSGSDVCGKNTVLGRGNTGTMYVVSLNLRCVFRHADLSNPPTPAYPFGSAGRPRVRILRRIARAWATSRSVAPTRSRLSPTCRGPYLASCGFRRRRSHGLSLRSFHLVFLLMAIVGADLFGAWAVWQYVEHKDGMILTLGIIAVLGGLGLIWYAFKLVRQLDRANVR